MIRTLAVLVACALFVGACGKLPRPFGRDNQQAPNPLAVNIFLDAVEVHPVAGTTLPMGHMLADAVVHELEKVHELPAATSGMDKSRFVLRGSVRFTGVDATSPGYAAIDWQLDERGKATVASFTQRIPFNKLQWDYGDARIFNQVRQETGVQVAKLVLGDRFGAGGRDRLLGKQGVHIAEIRGAPGDGNGALRRAMAVALAGASIKLTNDPEVAAFSLGAQIDLGAPENNVQSVSIVWFVRDIGGVVLGTAEQANAVPAGSLDGQWGRTAAFVAAAALDGILGIIDQHDPNQLRAPDLGSGPSRPSVKPRPRLVPQFPGRAPPPPR